MTTRRCVYVLAAALLTLAAASAAEKYTLKIEKPAQIGDRTQHNVSDHSDMNTVIRNADDKVLSEKKDLKEIDAVYVETVLAKPEGKRAEKLSRKYESATYVKNGKKSELDLVGKVLLIERKGKQHEFRYEDGAAVTGDTLEFLKDEFKSKDDEDNKMERAVMPKTAVAVGDGWDCDVKEVARMIGPDVADSIDLDKAKVTGKLVKAYQKDGATFGVMEIAINLPFKRLGPPGENIVADPGSIMSFNITLDACIDGSRTAGTMSGGMTADVAAKVKAPDGEFRLKVTGKGKLAHTQAPAK